MEQFSGIRGHVCLGALPPENQVTLWTNQAVALGANKILYFGGEQQNSDRNSSAMVSLMLIIQKMVVQRL